jgi:putative transposase
VTVTDDDSVARGSGFGPPGRLTGRQLREQLADDTWLDELIDRAEQGGVQLTGEGGFLPELVKAVLERGLDAELTDHLGYERGDPAGRGSPNSRNGTTPKTVQSQIGAMGLDVPRDRDSSFEPRLVPKGERRLAGLDDMIISLYAGGMTIRDIQHHLARTIGTELSHETISKITDAVAEEVKAWQARPLEPIYPIVYVDALVVKVRDGHQVRNKAAHLAVGVDTDGKEVLGIWVEAVEGAKFWLRVMNELKARGVEDVLIVVCDGLTGLPEAVTAVWPDTVVQTCIVHLTRASLRWVNYKDRKRVAAQLRCIYAAPTEAAAREALDAWTDSDIGRQYPAIKRQWEAAWEQVTPFFAFPPEVRKVLYTTNMIESINYQLRKISKTRGHFPTDQALTKLLYLGCRELGRTSRKGQGGRTPYAWKTALNQFDIMFPGRLDRA